jgi:hypothetical protein
VDVKLKVENVISDCCVKIGLLETILSLISFLEVSPNYRPDFTSNSKNHFPACILVTDILHNVIKQKKLCGS